MTQEYEVVIYGASGYTGKLTAWKLAETWNSFIAAGRSKHVSAEAMEKVAELRDTITCASELPTKRSPHRFIQRQKGRHQHCRALHAVGATVVEACLTAGCHYFDTTGETDWMTLLKKEFGAAFAAKGLALCPGNSYMWAEGKLATEIALETPGVDTLDVVYLADSDVRRCLGDVLHAHVHEAPVLSKERGAGAMALGDVVSGTGSGRAWTVSRAALERRGRTDLV